MRGLLFVSLLVAAGCATSPTEKPAPAPFALEMPAALEILNGQEIRQEIPVTWRSAEREDLELSVSIEPDGRGVNAEAMPPRLAGGGGPAVLVLSVGETAMTGDYRLTLTARTAGGRKARGTATVTVPSR